MWLPLSALALSETSVAFCKLGRIFSSDPERQRSPRTFTLVQVKSITRRLHGRQQPLPKWKIERAVRDRASASRHPTTMRASFRNRLFITSHYEQNSRPTEPSVPIWLQRRYRVAGLCGLCVGEPQLDRAHLQRDDVSCACRECSRGFDRSRNPTRPGRLGQVDA
jgi:hypothetical protein